jgi:hypothetical protein
MASTLVAAPGFEGAAWAQEERDPKLAQSLFDRARALMDQGQYAEACPLLEESQRLDPGGGTLLNFAVCLEQAGKLATAHTKFNEALSVAIREARDDRKKIAEERLAALAPKLSTITIEVPAEARVPGIVVWLDGAKLTQVAWGVPTAVDGGSHRIEATAPETKAWVTVVDISPEGHKVTVRVEAPRPLFEAVPEEDADRRLKPLPPPPAPGRKKRKKRYESRLSVATWVTGGVGLGMLIAGSGMGISAVLQDDELETEALDEGCNLARGYCTGDDAEDFATRAQDIQNLGWAATGLMATGAVMMIIAPLLPRDHVQIAPQAAVSGDGVTFGVSGRFD